MQPPTTLGSTTRRDFLGQSVVWPLSVALGGGLLTSTAAPAAEPIKRVGGAKLKLSINLYSFDKAFKDHQQGQGGMSLDDMLEFCVKLNVDAVDPTGYYFTGYPQPPSDRFLNDFKRRAFELGLDISGTGVKNNFANADSAKRTADVELVKQWIEVAARLGSPVIRVFAGPEPAGYSWDQAAAWMAEALQPCVEHGTKHGVIVGLQNHGDMLKTADEMLKMVQLVDSPWFGLIVDTGWFTKEDPYDDIARTIPHAVNWQIEERFHGNRGPKTDLPRLATIIRQSGYRGYIPIETLSGGKKDYDPCARVTELLTDLRAALSQTPN